MNALKPVDLTTLAAGVKLPPRSHRIFRDFPIEPSAISPNEFKVSMSRVADLENDIENLQRSNEHQLDRIEKLETSLDALAEIVRGWK